MSEHGNNGEVEVEEDEEENTETTSQPGGDEVHADRSTDVLQTVEEAETQADWPSDAEQLRDPQRKENVGNSTATVKVVLVPEGHVMTVAFAIGLSIKELKCHLASELRVPAEVLQISLEGRVVEDEQSLIELGVQPHGSTRMEMSSTDPTTPLRPLRPPEQDNMPDVITVRVQTDEGEFQEVVVEIERPRQWKPFLGGYRHQLTGIEYHHAAVQTLHIRRPDRGVVVFSRDTQTVQLKSRTQQCPVDVSSQTSTVGCYISSMKDKLISPGKYTTADEYHERRLRAVICLQSFTRRWLAQQEVARLRRERNRRIAWLDMQDRMRAEEKEKQLRDRRQRWMNPQTREDFNLKYQALEKWRCEEEQRINSSLQGAERKVALCELLDQETQLIGAIERHRIAFQKDNYHRSVRNFLDKCAAPRQWRAADGRLMKKESQLTIRAKELRDLYNNINQSTDSQDQRLSVLMKLKHTVNEHKCQLTREIVDLIDREVDLMFRNLNTKDLEGLKRRISTLFLQYIKTPEFNPEVTKLLKYQSKSKNDMALCLACHRYLPSTDFRPSIRTDLSGRCRHCTGLDNIARCREDLSCYKNILRRLRADELQINKETKIPFLLQVEDVQYLIEGVWASRSALSASSDLYNLVFVRWENQRDWSPWNCILLSKEEAPVHMVVEDVHEVYGPTFIHSINLKHMQARRHFSQISNMVKYMDSQLTVALGTQLVSKPIPMATVMATDNTPGSSH